MIYVTTDSTTHLHDERNEYAPYKNLTNI